MTQTATQAISQDVRSMLLYLGVDSFMVDILIPYVWFVPGAVDPDSPSIIELNKAIQRGLRAAGFKNVPVNGVLGRKTAAALDQVASDPGTPWMAKAFVPILGDVIKEARNPRVRFIKGGLGDYFEPEGLPVGPLPGVMVGTPPGPLGMGTTTIDAGLPLTFGQGITNSANMVPIPKDEGPTRRAFENLQRQINRLIAKLGERIAEDGIIGQGTLAAYRKVETRHPTTMELARHARSTASRLKGKADSEGISVGANKGFRSTPSSQREPTPQPLTQAQLDAHKRSVVGGAIKKYVPFLAVAGAVAVAVSMQRKGKGKKGKKR